MDNSTTPKLGDKGAILEAARRHKAKEKVPLLAHATMRWGRKINGRIHYFGKIDPNLPDFGAGAALTEYHRTADDIRAGREPRPKEDERISIADAANRFLSAKAALRDAGELTPRTWSDYHSTCSKIIDILGRNRAVADLQPDDFRRLRAAFAQGRGPVSLATDIRRARVFFRWCGPEKEGLIDRPCRLGTAFDAPSPKTLRQARAARGSRMFEADEIRQLLDAADPVLKAQIMLGLNAGFGQTDIAGLPISAIDFKTGWVDYARQKTGIGRRIPLWPETIKALEEAITVRPEPSDPAHAELAFLTSTGIPVVRNWLSTKEDKAEVGLTTRTDTVARAFTRLVKNCGLNGSRSFYALRHTLETIGGDTGDQVAVSAIMGHAPRAGDMSAVYRERIDGARLIAVTNHVRAWLWPNRRAGRTTNRGSPVLASETTSGW